MGIARKVEVVGKRVRVTMTPTFAACPALNVMKTQIEQRLMKEGLQPEVIFSNNPPWTSSWITPEAREKLRAFGLAPPPVHEGDFEAALDQEVTCPYCGSTDTVLQNSFGSTLCRMIYTCSSCRQPFEQFKPI
jgi:ring-1,2-phenylacetyl-CoA epoxidase subunit PaaD